MMISLKISARRSAKKYRLKFECVIGRELHCFRRYRPSRFVIHPVLTRKSRQRVSGYMVSELSTLSVICGGPARRDAIANAKSKMDSRNMSAWKLLMKIREAKKFLRSREGRRNFACA
ncbi:MAG: hypothetical protein Q8Q81_00530 [Oxalobacteraceae bacterium]|nr:hypothetical protein [Oxalobacteraceae bacterium]